jgi:hypothetical protein
LNFGIRIANFGFEERATMKVERDRVRFNPKSEFRNPKFPWRGARVVELAALEML